MDRNLNKLLFTISLLVFHCYMLIGQWVIEKDDDPFEAVNAVYIIDKSGNNSPFEPRLFAISSAFAVEEFAPDIYYHFGVTDVPELKTEDVDLLMIEGAIKVKGDWKQMPRSSIKLIQYRKNAPEARGENVIFFWVTEEAFQGFKKGKEFAIRISDPIWDKTVTLTWTLSGAKKAFKYLEKNQ